MTVDVGRKDQLLQFSWLESAPMTAHNSGMVNQPRVRLLEVAVKALKPDRWEWSVCEGDKMVMAGYATSRQSAQVEGNNALFHLLSSGIKP